MSNKERDLGLVEKSTGDRELGEKIEDAISDEDWPPFSMFSM
jgi:hypothetical protein